MLFSIVTRLLVCLLLSVLVVHESHSLLLAVGLAVAVAWLFGRYIARPIEELLQGTQGLIEGKFETRIETTRTDEFGKLQRNFNRLGEVLTQHEEYRRQWVADTSHELRTPLAVLRAEIEAIQDGIHEPDEKTLAVLHSEVLHLNKLVNDLYELARSDQGELDFRLTEVSLDEVVRETAEAFNERFVQGKLGLKLKARPVKVLADRGRLKQLFHNLCENSYRYTDPGGSLRIETRVEGDKAVVTFDDTAPAVDPQMLEQLFERFYRVEASRTRGRGGSGLGLAICKKIAEAHQGELSAELSQLGGLRFTLTLPRSDVDAKSPDR